MNNKLYSELAEWWPLVSPPADYAVEARQYAGMLDGAGNARCVLELGCGGGNTASHLKTHFEMTLVDISPQMLAVSQALNPECAHHTGDMRSARLGTEFDAVLVHDALSYMTTAEELGRAIETAAAHCRPGGIVLLVPDHFRETYRPGISSGGGDAGRRSLRYLQWDYDPHPADTVAETDFAFLLHDGDAPTRIVQDHHTVGVFERQLWLRLCERAGLATEIRLVHTAQPAGGRIEAICGRKSR